jgi:prepilin-type N-terminal cleavage/methylation domain-containing protein
MYTQSKPQHFSHRHFAYQQAGFSLLEMLIAFSLVSLLFVALFASFNTVARSWESSQKRMNKTEDRQLISLWLQRQLQQMVVLKLKKSAENSSDYAFSGEPKQLRFTAPLQPLQNKGGLYFIEFLIQAEVRQDKKYNMLTMRYAPYRPDMTWEQAFEAAKSVAIYQNFHQISFEYLHMDKIDAEAKWLTQWKDIQAYPHLLKIRLEAPYTEPWADIIIELPQVDDYLNTQHMPSKARNRSRSNRSRNSRR